MSLKLKVKLGRISGVVHTCEWCKYSTRSLNLFESHLNKCSPSASAIVPTVKKNQPRKKKKYWHKCDSCDFTANMIKEMTRHKAKYHGLKVIPCKECDYLARNRSKLNRHIGYRHNKNKTNQNGSLANNTSASVNLSSFETASGTNFDASTLSLNDKSMSQIDFKLNKYYNEVTSPSTLNESNAERNLSCRLCGCNLSNDEQVLNHLQNFHLPNDCIGHEIQTTSITGKRKSCEVSLYKCRSCNFCSEHKMIIVGHVIDCHPSCLVSAHFEGMNSSCAQSLYSSPVKEEVMKTYAYSCSDCLYKTNFKRNLKLHRTHHGADAPFRCTQCNFAAFHEIAVSRHRNNYHLSTNDKMSFNSDHQEGENLPFIDGTVKEEPVSDYDSKTVCADLSSTELPRFEEKNEQIWQCSYCPTRRYSDHKGLLKHMRIKHSRETADTDDFPSWRCPVCPFVGRSKKNLKMHMNKKKHGSLIEGIMPSYDNVPSPTVGMKPSDAPRGTRVHYEDKEGRPFFKCDHCAVSFSTYQAIAVHIAKAHKNEVMYKCHDCSFTSNRKYLLRNHLHACSKDPLAVDDLASFDLGDPSAEMSGNADHEAQFDESRLAGSSGTQARESTELVKYYGCSKCAYKTFRNFNLKKHIKLIHKGAKMIEILCQEEIHSNRDLEHKVGLTTSSYSSSNVKGESQTCLDIEIKQENLSDERVDPVVSTVDLDEEPQTRHFKCSERVQPLGPMDSEKQSVYYCDSKRMKCYKCLFCPKVTRGWNHYVLHRKMHFNAMANSKHKCKHCSYCSTSLKFLKKHEMLHKEEANLTSLVKENCIPQSSDPMASSKILYTSAPPEYKIKSGYCCNACPFRAKDLKTFYVHKNLHTPRGAKNKCTKCTYEVDCISKLRVHSKVHTMEYLLSNYKSVTSKEPREVGRLSTEPKSEPSILGSSIGEVVHVDRNRQEELDDFMESARNKHQIVASRRMACTLANSNPEGKQATESGPNGGNPTITRSTHVCMAVKDCSDVQSRPSPDVATDVKISTWHCERCPYIGQDSESLHRHITLHMNKRMYECMYCNYSVPTYYYLLEHVKLHQAPNRNLLYAQSANNLQFVESQEEAPACQKAIGEDLYENSRGFLSVPAKAFKCTYCPFSSRLRIFLIKHLKGHVTPREHRCPFCTYSSDSRVEIKKHCQIHFNLPGSDMNPYPESGQIRSKDGKLMSCKDYNAEFMEGIYARFGLNASDEDKQLDDTQVQNKADKSTTNSELDAGDASIKVPETETLISNGQEDASNENHLLSSHKSEEGMVTTDVAEEKPKEEDVRDQALEDDEKDTSKVEDGKKDDEEDLYIEVDELDNNDELASTTKDKPNEPQAPNLPGEEVEPRSAKVEPPFVCKFCGRVIKCLKSLNQHEAAHLGQCSYLKLTNPSLYDSLMTN